jgi:hypothetical protein
MFTTHRRKFIVHLHVYEVVTANRPGAVDAASDPPVALETVANFDVGMDVDWREVARGMSESVIEHKFTAVLKALERNAWLKLANVLAPWRTGHRRG